MSNDEAPVTAERRAEIRSVHERYLSTRMEQFGALSAKMAAERKVILSGLKLKTLQAANEAWERVVSAALPHVDKRMASHTPHSGQHERLKRARERYLEELKRHEQREALGLADPECDLIPYLDYLIRSEPRAAHKGTGYPVPPALILELEVLFEQYTGKKAGTGKGPFARLVASVWDAVGYGRASDTVIKDIRRAQPKARQIAKKRTHS